MQIFVFLFLFCLVNSSVIPQENTDNRVIDLAPAPSEDREGYDHQAFLGKEAEQFEQLTPEESKTRLGMIYDKIDKDNNGLVTDTELKNWIQYVQLRFTMNNVQSQWKSYHGDNANKSIAWVAYREKTYGRLTDTEEAKAESETGEFQNGGFNYRHLEKRDLRRWGRADENSDGHLSMEEFKNFLHPEEAEHMKDTVVEETIEDIDTDKDGKISLEEYIGDMWPKDDPTAEEPDWVITERTMWSEHRDTNKDGYMDRHEVRQWILPDGYDHISAEARHLIYEADSDKDGNLTKDEVLDKYNVFVSSQVTDYGDAIRRHDEF